MILATADQMRAADRATIDQIGLPGIVLMENAAQGAARVLWEAVEGLERLSVGVCCGRGNNGGDGLAMARILAGRGVDCTAYLFCQGDELAGDAAINLAVAKACGVAVVEIADEAAFARRQAAIAGHDLYIDALLGTGLNAPVRGRIAQAIALINRLGRPVLAVDIPSGLCAQTGRPLGAAVRATWTATFGLVKLGLALDPGEHVGRLSLVEIGIPPAVTAGLGCRAWLLDDAGVAGLLPPRPAGAHKGGFGHLLVVGGSLGKSGAPCLAALGGLRAGAGLVTAALPAGLNLVAETKLTAAMSEPLPQHSEGGLALAALPVLMDLCAQRQALVLGPGLGGHPESRELARRLLAACPAPVVVDADGLNALAGVFKPGAIQSPAAVITPHPGEAARLLGADTAAIAADRPAAARALAAQSGAVAVLKGARTLIAHPDGRLWVNPTGNPLLASGGSGDVLAGVIAGLMAQGASALDAALAGVYVHGLAADLAMADFGRRGLMAEELVDYLPAAFARLEAPGGGEEEGE
ncbi:MAG: NAD(P)H-hydrate dehydratase [Thermodesulfobacteriota bacterium]